MKYYKLVKKRKYAQGGIVINYDIVKSGKEIIMSGGS